MKSPLNHFSNVNVTLLRKCLFKRNTFEKLSDVIIEHNYFLILLKDKATKLMIINFNKHTLFNFVFIKSEKGSF